MMLHMRAQPFDAAGPVEANPRSRNDVSIRQLLIRGIDLRSSTVEDTTTAQLGACMIHNPDSHCAAVQL